MRYGKMSNDYLIKGDIVEVYFINKKGETFTILVDLIDLEKMKRYNWSVHKKKNSDYARCRCRTKEGIIYLHKYILEYGDGLQCDHINMNPLDNRRENLRVCNNQQNNWNKPPTKQNKSGVTGVYFNKQCNKWVVQMRINKRTKHFGLFENFEEAVALRKQLEKEHRGEFAPQ